MEIKELKKMIFIDEKKEVVIKSVDLDRHQDLIYKDWLSFVDDESNDNLILDDFGFGVVIGQYTIVLWVV